LMRFATVLSPQACGPAMQLSPINNDAKAKAAALPVASAANPATEEDPPKIRVVVRKRPLSKKEKEKGDEDIIEVNMGRSNVIVNETKLKVDLTKYVERHQVRKIRSNQATN
jgi:kinesin family protein 2/24